MKVVAVPDTLAGARLDKAVAELFTVPTATARRLCADGRVYLGAASSVGAGEPRRRGSKGDRVNAGDVVGVVDGLAWFVPQSAPVVPVLLEQPSLIVVDKPAGVACHPLLPGEGHTVVDALVTRFPELCGAGTEEREAGLLHRLDTGTSGCLALARSRPAWTRLRAAFHDVDKTYLAIVEGTCVAGVVDAPIGKDGADRMRIDDGGQPARTEITPLSTSVATTAAPSTLVRLQLFGGRRHQLRVHLASLGHPLVGDWRYARAGGASAVSAQRDRARAPDVNAPFFLHAWRLRIKDHDVDVDVTAPLPEAFVAELAKRGLRRP